MLGRCRAVRNGSQMFMLQVCWGWLKKLVSNAEHYHTKSFRDRSASSAGNKLKGERNKSGVNYYDVSKDG